jgi:hypothetical protein
MHGSVNAVAPDRMACSRRSPYERNLSMQELQKFQLRYENTLDDAVAASKFHCKNSPGLRRNRRTLLIIIALLALGFNWATLGFAYPLAALLYTAIEFAVGLTIGLGLRWLIGDRLIRRQYSGDKNRGFLGAHELELTDEGLIHRTAYSEGKMAWGMIERIETTKDYTFIYVGTASALVIPHARITGGSYEAFMRALAERFQPDQPLLRSAGLS